MQPERQRKEQLRRQNRRRQQLHQYYHQQQQRRPRRGPPRVRRWTAIPRAGHVVILVSTFLLMAASLVTVFKYYYTFLHIYSFKSRSTSMKV